LDNGPVTELKDVVQAAGSCRASPNGRFAVLESPANFRLCDIDRNAVTAEWRRAEGESVLFNHDSRMITIRDGNVMIANPEEGAQWHTIGKITTVSNSLFVPSWVGQYLVTYSEKGRLCLWEWPSLRLLKATETGMAPDGLAVEPSGKTIFVGGSNGIIKSYAVAGGHAAKGPDDSVGDVPETRPFLGLWTDGDFVSSYRMMDGKLTISAIQHPNGSAGQASNVKLVDKKLYFSLHLSEYNPNRWPPIAFFEVEQDGDNLIERFGTAPGDYSKTRKVTRVGTPAAVFNLNSPMLKSFLGKWETNQFETTFEIADGKLRMTRKILAGGPAAVATEFHLSGNTLLYQAKLQGPPPAGQPGWGDHVFVARVNDKYLEERWGPSFGRLIGVHSYPRYEAPISVPAFKMPDIKSDLADLLDVSEGMKVDDHYRIPSGSKFISKKEYAGPLEITMVARTEQLNIRLQAHQNSIIIFNWEGRPGAFHMRSPSGPLVADKRIPLTPNQW
jgi:hypothetical protein